MRQELADGREAVEENPDHKDEWGPCSVCYCCGTPSKHCLQFWPCNGAVVCTTAEDE